LYSYDSTPPADMRATDPRFQAGLTIDFQAENHGKPHC
jgi:hypothetical protein